MKKITQTVDYLHSKGIIHRDLKSENIMCTSYENPEYKLIDFGLSTKYHTIEKEKVAGTPLYMAPEIIRGDEYNQSCDSWSLGVILYILLVGYAPFKGKKNEILYKIENAYYE